MHHMKLLTDGRGREMWQKVYPDPSKQADPDGLGKGCKGCKGNPAYPVQRPNLHNGMPTKDEAA
jgi:hypothetical protein